jgi:hypothetical protein
MLAFDFTQLSHCGVEVKEGDEVEDEQIDQSIRDNGFIAWEGVGDGLIEDVLQTTLKLAILGLDRNLSLLRDFVGLNKRLAGLGLLIVGRVELPEIDETQEVTIVGFPLNLANNIKVLHNDPSVLLCLQRPIDPPC